MANNLYAQNLEERIEALEAEVERYRNGMANWKDAAEEKDRQFVAQLEESVERRMAALVSWNHWRERAEEAEAQLAQQDGALDTYLTNNYPAAVGDSVSARAINALETMDVQLGMKSAQQDGVVPFNEHDAGIIKDIEAMANGVEGFWPRALAIAALRLIRRPSSQPTPEAVVKAALDRRCEHGRFPIEYCRHCEEEDAKGDKA